MKNEYGIKVRCRCYYNTFKNVCGKEVSNENENVFGGVLLISNIALSNFVQ